MGLDLWIERRYDDKEIRPTEEMYWRKAYPVMDWFESHFDGVENCKAYEIGKSDIEELRLFCSTIIEEESFAEMDALPIVEWTTEAEITEWFDWQMDWVKHTLSWIDGFLTNPEEDYENLFFIAWW